MKNLKVTPKKAIPIRVLMNIVRLIEKLNLIELEELKYKVKGQVCMLKIKLG